MNTVSSVTSTSYEDGGFMWALEGSDSLVLTVKMQSSSTFSVSRSMTGNAGFIYFEA